MKFDERVYSLILRLYPRRFRIDYGEPMRQAFRDRLRERPRNVWRDVLADSIRAVPRAHWDELTLTHAASYLFFVAAMAFLYRFEIHTDDTGVVVFFMLSTTFLLGCLNPRRAFIWALGPLCAPASDLVNGARGQGTSTTGGFLLLCAFVTAVGVAGAYSGASCRKAFGSR